MKVTKTENNGITIISTMGDISLDSLGLAKFQKPETLTAQIRQVIQKLAKYPEQKVTSNLQGGLFATEAFGFKSTDYDTTENRVAFLYVPITATKEQILDLLVKANTAGAVIYRALSNEPVLDDNQIFAIKNTKWPERTYDFYANKYVVRVPKNDKTEADGTAGKILLDRAGNVQYRRTFFWPTPLADIDRRTTSKPGYMTPQIKAALDNDVAFDVVAGVIETEGDENSETETITAGQMLTA